MDAKTWIAEQAQRGGYAEAEARAAVALAKAFCRADSGNKAALVRNVARRAGQYLYQVEGWDLGSATAISNEIAA